MKSKRLLPFILLSFFLAQYAISQTADEDAIKEKIENFRNALNQQMMDAETSPLSTEQLANFPGLSFFPTDLNYRVEATFKAEVPEKEVSLNTTSGGKLKLKNVGTVTFELNGKTHSLAVFRNDTLPEFDRPQQLFIPFTDKSSGTETNKLGRYLVIDQPNENNQVIVDFNMARNPFNAYNSNYSSVIPPSKNSMSQTITAGERKFEDR
ncbi:MAG: DUF1684 domain-containing protein [Bacteroidales bacterium]